MVRLFLIFDTLRTARWAGAQCIEDQKVVGPNGADRASRSARYGLHLLIPIPPSMLVHARQIDLDSIVTTLTTTRPTSQTPTYHRWGSILKWDGGNNGENDKRVMLKMGGKEQGEDRVAFDIQLLILSSHAQQSWNRNLRRDRPNSTNQIKRWWRGRRHWDWR